MKKITKIVLIILVIATLIPVSVFAATAQDVTVSVRNRSGAKVEMSLTDANGNQIFYALEEGVTAFDITEGVYTFWAGLPCGNVTGEWNINVSKTLFLSCHEGTTAFLTRTAPRKGKVSASCSDHGLYVGAYGDFFSETNWLSDTMTYDEWVAIIFDSPLVSSSFESCITDVDVFHNYYTEPV